jgi:LacI family transcriptional regulator
MMYSKNSGKRAVTMKDISDQTGFSVNTVSRVLKSKDNISDQTRNIIMKTAKEIGYIGNSIAGSLRSGETKTIAIIVSDVSNPLFGIMVKEIENELRKSNYCTFVLNSDEKYLQEEQAVNLALSKKVDGIIICPAQSRKDDIEMIRKNGTSFVLMGRHFEDIDTDYVVWDDKKGGYLATSHLIERGHSHILFLNGPRFISSAGERLEGYCKALADHHLDYNPLLVRQTKVNSGECLRLFNKLKEEKVVFTAVFAFNDILAWEAVSVLTRLGIRVPEDKAVVGFDNIQSELEIPFSLTTVNTPKALMAKKVVKILLDKLSGKGSNIVHEVIDTRLVIGSST